MVYQLYKPTGARKANPPFVNINGYRMTLSILASKKYIDSNSSHVILRYDLDTNRISFDFTDKTEGAIKITKSKRYNAIHIAGLINVTGWNKDACEGRHDIHDADETSEYPYIYVYEV